MQIEWRGFISYLLSFRSGQVIDCVPDRGPRPQSLSSEEGSLLLQLRDLSRIVMRGPGKRYRPSPARHDNGSVPHFGHPVVRSKEYTRFHMIEAEIMQKCLDLDEFRRCEELSHVLHHDDFRLCLFSSQHELIPELPAWIADPLFVQQGKALAGRSADDCVGFGYTSRRLPDQVMDVTVYTVSPIGIEIQPVGLQGRMIVVIGKDRLETSRLDETMRKSPASRK